MKINLNTTSALRQRNVRGSEVRVDLETHLGADRGDGIQRMAKGTVEPADPHEVALYLSQRQTSGPTLGEAVPGYKAETNPPTQG